jgi:hypothetical protein
MVNHRQRTEVIDPDYLRLLDIEFDVFGRNREHMIHLPNPVRENVGKFVNECAIRRAEIGTYRSAWNKWWALVDRLRNQGQVGWNQGQAAAQEQLEQAELVRKANEALAKANKALDQLAIRVKDCADLVNSLKDVH